MNAFLVILVALVAVALLLAAWKKPLSRSHSGYPYRQIPYLLSKAERSFYGVLVQAVGEGGLVFAKVRVADVLTPQKGLSRSHWQRAFNQISAKHFDFVICDPGDCSVKLAVELDDASHGAAKRVKRDALLDSACESAGLPILRIKAAKGYVMADQRAEVNRLLFPGLPTEPVPEEGKGQADVGDVKTCSPVQLQGQSESSVKVAPETQNKEESRNCHKCGLPMVLRKAKAGKHAGQVFWGCSGFPKCRMVVKVGVDARCKT